MNKQIASFFIGMFLLSQGLLVAHNGLPMTLHTTVAKGTGKLIEVEDAGYPIFILTVKMQNGETKGFEINVEEVNNVDAQKLQSWIGKDIDLDYTTANENALMALRSGNTLIIDEGEYQFGAQTKKVTGTLKAPETTKGDLPDVASVITAAGKQFDFPFFITEEMTHYHDHEVTAYYEVRSVSTVNSVQLKSSGGGSGGEGVPFSVVSGYFVKNGYMGENEVMPLGSNEDLRAIFGSAGASVPIDFSKNFAISIILPETSKSTSVSIKSLQIKGNGLLVTYEVKEGGETTYTSRPTVIVKVDRKYVSYAYKLESKKIVTRM